MNSVNRFYLENVLIFAAIVLVTLSKMICYILIIIRKEGKENVKRLYNLQKGHQDCKPAVKSRGVNFKPYFRDLVVRNVEDFTLNRDFGLIISFILSGYL